MKQSAGLLVYKKIHDHVEVLLTHPGGPYYTTKDSWSIPKGEQEPDETLLQTMAREFLEEMGIEAPLEHLIELGSAPNNRSKINHIWAAEADLDLSHFRCDSMVMIELPPRSSKIIRFPENDKAAWFDLKSAGAKIKKQQLVFLQRLAEYLDVQLDPAVANK